ncbi:splicing factor, suppressor of white-apricot homolog isoform X2 [Homalodisca vitripennis]|uniref:splicing factor, suppressor of white-apricot homolog isoform X2 n=1 Tax=Homalodisca vitripennis TaxID=197043 RepID=UPI001EEA1A24|nr:splicing factor, suppressor of white-apricot homolog isoform X2 [Homalodisca vitripennis]
MNKDRRWVNPNDPGILRKKNDENLDLLVFGYSCKIFRDDHRALEMDQGKQLIPWMGDESLKIDRYDARGHLSDLSPYEGASQVYVPTAEERKIEGLCDEERYRALSVNEEESLLYQEEELKRLKQLLNTDKTYGQVAYKYTETAQMSTKSESSNSDVVEPDDEEFIPSPLLDIPPNMLLPRTVRKNQIIEKTAAHVAVHGSQVEIVIKTRQAKNEKLNFLRVDNPLYPYYQFVLSSIKSGRYHIPSSSSTTAANDLDQEHYLHPSLVSTVEAAPSIPSIPYKPSSDCAYNALVKNIRTVQEAAEQPREEPVQSSLDSSSEEGRSMAEWTTEENPLVWADKSPRLQAPPDHLFTTSTSSPGPPPPTERKKRKWKPPHLIPSDNKAKRLISGMVKYAHRLNREPSALLFALGGSGPNINFTQPGHFLYEYYRKQYKTTFQTTNEPRPYPAYNGGPTGSAPSDGNERPDMPEEQNTIQAQIPNTLGERSKEERLTPVLRHHMDVVVHSPEANALGVQIEEQLSPVLTSPPFRMKSIKNNEDKVLNEVPPKAVQTAEANIAEEKVSTAPNEKTKSKPSTSQLSQPSSSGDGSTRTGKPAPVSFSIKKPKEERLEHASIFPLEESSNEEDEEGKELKSSNQKVETEKSQSLEKQQSPIKENVREDLDFSAVIDWLNKEQEEINKSKKRAVEKTSDTTSQKSTKDPSTKDSRSKDVAANGKHVSATCSSGFGRRNSKSPTKGESRKSPKASTKGEERRKGSTSKSENKKTGHSTRDHSRKRKHERKETSSSTKKMVKKTADLEEELFSDLLSVSDDPDVATGSSDSVSNRPLDSRLKEERRRKVKEMLAKFSHPAADTTGLFLSKPRSSTSKSTEDTEVHSSAESSIYLSTQSSANGKSSRENTDFASSQENLISPEKKETAKPPAEETEEMMRQRVKEALTRYNKAASETFPIHSDQPNSPMAVHIRDAPLHLMSSTIKKIEEETEKHQKSPTAQNFNPTGIWDPDNPTPSTSNSTDIRYSRDSPSKTKPQRSSRPPPGFEARSIRPPPGFEGVSPSHFDFSIINLLINDSTTVVDKTSNTTYRLVGKSSQEPEGTQAVQKPEKTATRTSLKKKSSRSKSPDVETGRVDKTSKIEEENTKKRTQKKHHHSHSHKSKKNRKKPEKYSKQSKHSRSASTSSSSSN